MSQTRRLAAILAADVAGYSRLIGADEEGTLNRLKSIRADIIDPKITEHRGRIVKTTGDGLLVEFSSVVDALRCATQWQRGMIERDADLPSTSRIEFRMGINVGDVVVEDDIFGDGVNVAARLEGTAEPGGICVSARVQEDVAGRLDLIFDNFGSPGPAIDFGWRLRRAAPMPANFRSQDVSDLTPPGSSRDRHQPRP
jgi:adenylate cyclase